MRLSGGYAGTSGAFASTAVVLNKIYRETETKTMTYYNRYFATLYDLIACMTAAVDLLDVRVANHHQRVAFMSLKLGEQMGLPVEERRTLVQAALLHDIGALTLSERLQLITGEATEPEGHARIGARFLEDFPLLRREAEIVRFHHVPWRNGAGGMHHGAKVPLLSHMLHLADRAVVQIRPDMGVISQIGAIREAVAAQRGEVFVPETVDAFLAISMQEALWLELADEPRIHDFMDELSLDAVKLTLDEVVKLTDVFAHIIDFRSPFTTRHSASVAATAEKLAELSGFSENECKMMRIAGNLHDLGKLAIPSEILEKRSKLDPDEFDIIRGHTFYTYRLLRPIRGFETINQWASYHHERLSGNGYPFHLKADSLPLGSRIMAVADIFTAVTEDRPYRKGMSVSKTEALLRDMARHGAISPDLVSLLLAHHQEISHLREEAADQAGKQYDRLFLQDCV